MIIRHEYINIHYNQSNSTFYSVLTYPLHHQVTVYSVMMVIANDPICWWCNMSVLCVCVSILLSGKNIPIYQGSGGTSCHVLYYNTALYLLRTSLKTRQIFIIFPFRLVCFHLLKKRLHMNSLFTVALWWDYANKDNLYTVGFSGTQQCG